MLEKTQEFGCYPYIYENEMHALEWNVLEETDEYQFLLSKHMIDSRPFHSECVEVSWDESDIKKWLNEDFFNRAFTPEEQEKILFNQEANAKVFLLSADEIEKYCSKNQEKICTSTYYAEGHGAPWEVCQWWLREAGLTADRAMVILEAGFSSCGSGPVIGARTATILRPGRYVMSPGIGIRLAILLKK